MTRIAKTDVFAALQKAANNIIDAGGADGRISRKDLKAKLATLDGTEKKLTDVFFRFVDHRDFKSGATVTAANVNSAVEYAKEHMIAKYDLNNNGLSAAEVARMSLTGQLAVNLAKALKDVGALAGGTKLPSEKLGAAIAPLAENAWYVSESDYQAQYFAVDFPAGHDVTGHNALTAMKGTLAAFYETTEADFLANNTFEVYSASDAREFMKGLSELDPDIMDDDYYRTSAEAYGKINDLLKANLTDLKVIRFGSKDQDVGGVADSQGLYAKCIVGRTQDGKLAGVIIGAVET